MALFSQLVLNKLIDCALTEIKLLEIFKLINNSSKDVLRLLKLNLKIRQVVTGTFFFNIIYSEESNL